MFWVGDSRSKYRQAVPNVIRPNMQYTAVFKVRKDRLEATINGKAILSLKTDFSDLEVGSWHRIKEPHKIAVFCDDPAVFSKIELVEVSGKGTLTRQK